MTERRRSGSWGDRSSLRPERCCTIGTFAQTPGIRRQFVTKKDKQVKIANRRYTFEKSRDILYTGKFGAERIRRNGIEKI